jgi:hypothetical protein
MRAPNPMYMSVLSFRSEGAYPPRWRAKPDDRDVWARRASGITDETESQKEAPWTRSACS